MIAFANIQRQYPEVWIRQNGPVTARQMMIRYKLTNETVATTMLDNLVRDGRLVRTTENGVVRWAARQR